MGERRKRWFHIIINARCSWLHGDKRGFRSRGHRIHSSGDYKNPPPLREHAGLRKFHIDRSQRRVSFNLDVRIRIAIEFVKKLKELGHRVIACSVGAEHLHVIVELPDDRRDVKFIIGNCKQRASHSVRDVLPSTIWSGLGEYRPIRDLGHFRNAYVYVRTKQERGTVVWSHRDDEDWIRESSIGIIVMGLRRSHVRIFAKVGEKR